MGWKYIILKAGNRERPFIFPDVMVHAMVADSMKMVIVREAIIAAAPNQLSTTAKAKLYDDIKVVAAGELSMDIFWTGGFSETLGVGARTADASVMNLLPYTHGLVEEEPDGG